MPAIPGWQACRILVKTLDPVPVVLVAAIVFAACFVLQLTAGRYVPWRY